MKDTWSKLETASLLGVSIDTLDRWCKDGRFPAPIRFSRRFVRFRKSDVRDFIEQTLQGSTVQPA
jgi:excisionase family DNA binding protein